jgi:hypothetical protein
MYMLGPGASTSAVVTLSTFWKPQEQYRPLQGQQGVSGSRERIRAHVYTGRTGQAMAVC